MKGSNGSLWSVITAMPKINKSLKCITAPKDSPYRIIMSVGEHTDISSLGDIPKNFLVVKRIDQMAALQVADVFVTHCGMNSVNEALYSDVPMVLAPQIPEQSGVANRTSEVGASLFLTGNEEADIRTAIDTVL